MWILIGLVIFVIMVGILLACKIHSPFWFHQPVYHTYEIYPKTLGYWSKPYLKTFRPCNLYHDSKHVKTYTYSDLSIDQKTAFLHFVQAHYLDTERFLYDIQQPQMDMLLSGQPYASTISIYSAGTPAACMATHAQSIWFREICFPILIWDFVCLHRDHKPVTLHPLIQTHLNNQKDVRASLWKTETTLSKGVVPLVQFKTYTFFLQKTPVSKLPFGYKIKRIEKRTMSAWMELYERIPLEFDVCLMPALHNTIETISEEHHYVFLLIRVVKNKEEVRGIYIFKDCYTRWEVKRVFSVYSMCKDDPLIFYQGFVHAVKELYYQKKDFGVLNIDTMGHNSILLQNWRYPMHMVTDSAYYLYNLIYPQSPVQADRVFIF